MDKTLAEMQIEARETVAFYIDLANEIYGLTLSVPTILFNIRGMTAGTANYSSWKLRFNNVLLAENFTDMIENTVPHEVAHLVARSLHDYRIKPHGYEWKSVMRDFGRKPERCHSYDVSNARVRRRGRQERVTMYCEGCNRSVNVGPIQYKRWRKGAEYRTRCCRGKLTEFAKVA